jgi:hypothetical protein
VESTRGLQEGGPLRGGSMERRSWPARDTERGPSHPGKPGAMDHARRDRSTPGSGGSVLATKGCSAGFGGGKSAKSPKGCGPFTPGRPVRGCTSTNVARRWWPLANPPRVVLPRRAAGGVPLEGKRKANARRSSAPQGARGRRRARRRRTWMCPYAVVSLQKSIGGFDPEKPFPQHVNTRKGARGSR